MQNIFFPFSFVFHLAFYFFLFVLITNFFRFFISFLVITGAHSNTKSRERDRKREKEREGGRERERLLAVALYLCYAVDRSILPLFILLFAIISFCHSFFVRFSPLLNRHLEEKETINQSIDKN